MSRKTVKHYLTVHVARIAHYFPDPSETIGLSCGLGRLLRRLLRTLPAKRFAFAVCASQNLAPRRQWRRADRPRRGVVRLLGTMNACTSSEVNAERFTENER